MKKNKQFLLIAIMMISLVAGCTGLESDASSINQVSSGSLNVTQEPIINSQLPKLTIGQAVQIEDFGEYTLKAVVLYDDFKAGLISLEKNTGVKRLVFIFEGKNLTNQEISPSSFIKISVLYKGNYEYETDDYMGFSVPDSNSFPPKLMPLKVSTIFSIVEIPDEVAQALENVKATIKLKEQEYQYDGGIETAVQYISNMREMNSNLDKVLEDLYSIAFDMRFTFSPTKEDIAGFGKRFAEQKLILDGVKDALSKATPPSYYKQGHETLINGITLLQESLQMVAIEEVQEDLTIYSDIFTRAGEIMTEAENHIDQAKEDLDFFSW